jgi:hypothetical protein
MTWMMTVWDSVGVHEVEQGLDGGVCGIWVDAGGEGEGWIGLPDVDVGVDQGLRFLGEGS